MQILNFFITAAINVGISGVLFLFLLLGRQTSPGFILYVAWTLIASFLAAALSVLLAKYLIGKKSFNPLVAIAISSPIFIITGGVASVIGVFTSVFIIEALW